MPWYLHLASDRKTDDWMNDFFPWMRWCADPPEAREPRGVCWHERGGTKKLSQ